MKYQKGEIMKTNRRILYILFPIVMLALLGALFAGSACAPPGTIPSKCQPWYEKGKQEGYDQGLKEGYDRGKADGKEVGFSEGYVKGLQEGKNLCPGCPQCPDCPQYPQQPYYYPYYGSPYYFGGPYYWRPYPREP